MRACVRVCGSAGSRKSGPQYHLDLATQKRTLRDGAKPFRWIVRCVVFSSGAALSVTPSLSLLPLLRRQRSLPDVDFLPGME